MPWIEVENCPDCGCQGQIPPCDYVPLLMAYRQRYRLTITNRTCAGCWNGYTTIIRDYSGFSEWLPEPFPAPPVCCPGGQFDIRLGTGGPGHIELSPFMSGQGQACEFCVGRVRASTCGMVLECDIVPQHPILCDGQRWVYPDNVTQIANPPFLQLRNVPVCHSCDGCTPGAPQICYIDITITEVP